MLPAEDTYRAELPLEAPSQVTEAFPEQEVERLLRELSKYARKAGFYQGLLEGTLLRLESEGKLDQEIIDHIRAQVREASGQAPA